MRRMIVSIVVMLGLAGCTSSGDFPTAQPTSTVTAAPSQESPSPKPPTPSKPPISPPSSEVSSTPEPQIDIAGVAAKFANQQPAQWGLEVTGVVTQLDSPGIALTLDACGGPNGSEYDAALIDGLIERNVAATLFVNKRWIEENPQIAQELAENPFFELANHGSEHRPLSVNGESAYGISGTNSVAQVIDEVWENHQVLAELTGEEPRYFRSGTAHYDDVAVGIVAELGEKVVGFTVNADAGATFSADVVRDQLIAAQPGDIVIAHMNQPRGGTAEGLLAGVDEVLERGGKFTFLGLSEGP